VLQQVTASLMVLLLTGFVLLGIGNATHVDLGFEPSNLYVMSVDPVRDGYPPAQASALLADLPERLGRVPGVTSACLAASTPAALIGGENLIASKMNLFNGPRQGRRLRGSRVGAGFFETLGISLVQGRTFREDDERAATSIVIVNETMAREEWPGQRAVGQVLDAGTGRFEVVGVVGDIRPVFAFDKASAQVYFPVSAATLTRPSVSGVTLYVRGGAGVDGTLAARRELDRIDPTLTLFNAGSMDEQVRRMLYLMRVVTAVYGGVGVFGLLLAAVGLGGVTAHAVARRTHEVGVRVALGAARRDVLRLVLGEGVAIVGVATVLGLVAAFATLRALRSFLEALAAATETSTSNPWLIVGAPALLATLALLACYVPARRALRINPVEALRAE